MDETIAYVPQNKPSSGPQYDIDGPSTAEAKVMPTPAYRGAPAAVTAT